MSVINEIVQTASGNRPLQVNVNLQPEEIIKIAGAVFIGVLLATLLAGLIVKRYG
jgi:hypothetical protein